MIPSITDDSIEGLQVKTGLIFDQERRRAIKEFVDIQACPGSGKTTLIAAKLILLAKIWKQGASGICVLSHTNVAKNEIISRLEGDDDGRQFLSSPHFIGTIQEFVNRFLALPYCRSMGIGVKRIDDDFCCKYIEDNFAWGTKKALENKKNIDVSDLQFRYVNHKFETIVPWFKKSPPSASYNNLCTIKENMLKEGFFFFREMFEFSKAYLDINPKIIEVIRSRFPLALVDEMQDTSIIQDEIMNKIFAYEGGAFQRFGDTDQAIFSGNNKEDSNSYNNLNLQVINTSHRFNSSIAALASRLSTNKVSLCSTQTVNEVQPHTIFIVNDQSRIRVFSAFAHLCANNLHVDENHPIKAVGGVGKTKPESLTLKHYFPNFEKNSSLKKLKPGRFIEYFRESQKIAGCNAGNYKIILKGIRKLLVTAGYEYKQISELKGRIKDSQVRIEINKNIINIQKSDLNDSQAWDNNVKKLLTALRLMNKYTLLSDFISYVEPSTPRDNKTVSVNTYVEKVAGRDICIELDTIHSVKGETHAATLILETMFYKYDVHQMLDYIVGITNKKTKGVHNSIFMKRLYVAMTRPKHLIGIAIDESRFPIDKRTIAIANGWNLVDLSGGKND